MKQTIGFSQFCDAFQSVRPDNFSYDGLKALFEFLENWESDMGEEYDLDVIALCCEYSEFESLESFQNDYGEDYETMEDIESATTVINIDDESFIIQQF